MSSTFHVDLPLSQIFVAPTIAELARLLEQPEARQIDLMPIRHASHDGPVQLSFAQERLWFLELLLQGNGAYNMPLALRFIGELNIQILEQSFNKIIERHEVLRTTVQMIDGHPVQAISSDLRISLRTEQCSTVDPAQRSEQITMLILEESRRSFDLIHGPLIRVLLICVEPHVHIMVVSLHHIIFDEWSIDIFSGELAAFYEALTHKTPLTLADVTIQYADFTRWERAWLQGPVLAHQLDYWRTQLRDAHTSLPLPTDRPRRPYQTYQGRTYAFRFPLEQLAALHQLSQQEHASLFMAALASFFILLSRYTAQTDLIVGTPIAKRNRPELDRMIGLLINTLAIRVDIGADPTFRQLLARVRASVLGAYEHQDLPFEKLVDELGLERNVTQHPLFQAMFVYYNGPLPLHQLSGLTMEQLDIERGVAKFDLSLFWRTTETGVEAALEYRTDLFDEETIIRMAQHLQMILRSIVADPNQRLSAIQLHTPAEQAALVSLMEKASTSSPATTHYLAPLEDHAAHKPGGLACVGPYGDVPYAVLIQQATQLAEHLGQLGVGPDQCVGLYIDHRPEEVIALVGILTAGAAILPLEINTSPEQIRSFG